MDKYLLSITSCIVILANLQHSTYTWYATHLIPPFFVFCKIKFTNLCRVTLSRPLLTMRQNTMNI